MDFASTLGWHILYNSAALPEVSRSAQPENKQTTRVRLFKSADPPSFNIVWTHWCDIGAQSI